jgi:hypothetical protein
MDNRLFQSPSNINILFKKSMQLNNGNISEKCIDYHGKLIEKYPRSFLFKWYCLSPYVYVKRIFITCMYFQYYQQPELIDAIANKCLEWHTHVEHIQQKQKENLEVKDEVDREFLNRYPNINLKTC